MSHATDPTAPVHDLSTIASLLSHRSLCYSERQLTAIGLLPEPLPGFVTFFDPGWSISYQRTVMTSRRDLFYPQQWYRDQPFAKTEEQPRYRQLRMEAPKDSFRKAYDEQRTLLGPDEEVPTARTVIMGMVLHFLATGQRLFPNYWVRCSDTTSFGYRVRVGYFDARGLYVNDYWDDDRYASLGVAVARKSS